MTPQGRSVFTIATGSRAKWVVFTIWFVGIFIAAGPLNLPAKFTDAEENESTSFLPGDAESTKALIASEDLQGGELAPAAIVYRRASGLTDADRAKIVEDVGRLTEERFPGVIADGATAASGGNEASGAPPAQADLPEGCAGPTTPIEGQPSDYAPFVGPICSEDGKAAIVTAYIKGDGESDTVLDPVQFWRDTVSDPGGGLEVKITGGAGYGADAIEVFEGINGTLLLAAVTLVIVLLILIYRSPIFLFIPLAAVMFAEILARSVGVGLSELGVTVNGQSSSIMSILVLGAGTDYALLIVARYREELHHTADRHEAMRAAMASAGPAVFASAATVIVALFCLTIAKVNGTSGMGPIGAMGVACAALSMLTLLPALLTIFGRRAFWPFVPHTAETAPVDADASERARARIVDGGSVGALLRVIGAALVVAILLPLVILNALLRGATGQRIPSLIVGPLDRAIFKPYELRRLQARAPGRRDPRLLEARGRSRGAAAAARDGEHDRDPARVLRRARVLLHRPHHERQLHDRGRVGAGPGPDQRELPRRRERAHRRDRARSLAGGGRDRRRGGRGRRGVRVRPGRRGRAGRARPGDPRAAAVLDRGVRPHRPDPRGGRRAPPRARSWAAPARSSSTSARPPRGTRR